MIMRDASLTIYTTVDGEESCFSSKAEMEITSLSAVLRYIDSQAVVVLTLRGNQLLIERQGDYGLRLNLQEGEETLGTLSIAGNEGEVKVFTERLAWAIGKNTLILQAYYTLNFGNEKQMMRLRLKASQNSLEEK